MIGHRMLKRRLTSAILLGSLAFALGGGPVSAAPPADLPTRIESLLATYATPGLSLAIVEKGKPVLVSGYGVRALGAPARVDERTIFPIASVSKAFTASALAVLVDEGKIGWDDKVVDHLPGFRLYDPLASQELTVRDLLVHRSGLGLGAGDLLFVPASNLSRAETVKRLRGLKPASSFRSGYAYDNLLYIVAGQLIEEVSGKTWEAFVTERLLAPAGMVDAVTDTGARLRKPNRAGPHARLDGPGRGLGTQQAISETDALSQNAAPGGAIVASAQDMSRWVEVQLNQGLAENGHRLFTAKQAREMWTPQTLMPIDENAFPSGAAPQFQSYALGWKVTDYRGRKIVWHTGGIFGFRSVVVLCPSEDVGFAIMINSEDTSLVMGLMYELLDHYIVPGQPVADWPQKWASFSEAQARRALETAAARSPSGAAPPLPLASYAGEYADPWYGPMSVKLEGGRLMMNFKQSPGMVGEMQPRWRDTFLVRWQEATTEPAIVSYSFTPQGRVDRIKMQAASPLADFSYDYHDLEFTPIRP